MIGVSHIGIAAGRGGVGAPSVTYPADLYPDMSFAFGFIKASSSYTGDCLEIQRDSDGAYEYVPFGSNGIADLSGVLSWAGSDTVRVTIIYDSTGNGNYAFQNTVSSQIIIASGGVLTLLDNQLNFQYGYVITNGSNSPLTASPIDVYQVFKTSTTSGTQRLLGLGGLNANIGVQLIAQLSTATNISVGFTPITYYQDGVLKSWANRTAVFSDVVSPNVRTQLSMIGGRYTSSSANLTIGGEFAFNFRARGALTTWGWATDTSADRTAIETLLNDKVNITVTT